MFLKSVTLRGFKTFADVTTIEFPTSAKIFALVGPNGCGKSNLLDALRWVLGEDNPRQLRVAGLSEIIFAGSTHRKPLSLAEINLFFDNSSGLLPLPFSEVSIKRRTYREGESEFFLNGNACRLKNIRDLLLDTGLGEGSYAIITQGEVDLILSSRGEERRLFFEEVCGIAKYKSRKLVAERKLIAAEQNFLRINDLKIEVAEQLITLEEQARKAKEYQAIQNRVKELELGLSKQRFKNLLKKKNELDQQIAEIRQETEAEKISEEKEEEKLFSLKGNLNSLNEEIEKLNRQIDDEKDKLRDIELERRFKQGEIERAKRELVNLQKKKEDLTQRITSFTPDDKSFTLFSLPEWGEVLSEFFAYGEKLNYLMRSILNFFGKKQTLKLADKENKEDKDQILQEYLTEELKKADAEKQRINFSLRATESELEALFPDAQKKDRYLSSLIALRQRKEELEIEIKSLEEKVKFKIKAGEKERQEEISLEVSRAKIEGEISALTEKIFLEYSLSLEDLLSLSIEGGNLSFSKTEVEQGKLRLRQLEPVNLLAIGEFERCKERLSFLESQLQDLQSAQIHLQSLIQELDAKAKENFLETLQKLSTIFSEIFAKLFSGGEAKIFLLQPQMPLTSDIEISVRPFGRRWLPLTLLSGGERALCAIALLFAFLKIRPSPFCFLDEVDAALDEANILRFTQLLKDFSQSSQIILITHSKQTMAIADVIYGITMEEPGISKIISLRLVEASA